MTISLPFAAQSAGIPTHESDTLVSLHKDLIVGDLPRVTTQDHTMAASTAIGELVVVGLDASAQLVPAVWDATYASGGVRPIGVAVIAKTSGSGQNPGLPVYRTGCFNVDALVWPASFDTDAKKFAAFEGAQTPTQITLRRVKQATV